MYITAFLIKKSFSYMWHTGHTRRFGKGINTDFIRSNGSLYPVSDNVLMVQDIKDFTLREYTELILTPNKLHDHAIEVKDQVQLTTSGVCYYQSKNQKCYLSEGVVLYAIQEYFGRTAYLTKWGAKVSFERGIKAKDVLKSYK